MPYLRDPGESGWSDHEAFELAGIPAAWIEWRDDPVYHTAADKRAAAWSRRRCAPRGSSFWACCTGWTRPPSSGWHGS